MFIPYIAFQNQWIRQIIPKFDLRSKILQQHGRPYPRREHNSTKRTDNSMSEKKKHMLPRRRSNWKLAEITLTAAVYESIFHRKAKSIQLERFPRLAWEIFHATNALGEWQNVSREIRRGRGRRFLERENARDFVDRKPL